jgi:hypothetical protein
MFISSLFIPYEYKATFSPIYEKSNKRLLCKLETFISLDHPSKTYIPKKEWGMDPFENEIWTHFDGIEKQVNNSIEEKQPYCVGKKKIPIQLFFIGW